MELPVKISSDACDRLMECPPGSPSTDSKVQSIPKLILAGLLDRAHKVVAIGADKTELQWRE